MLIMNDNDTPYEYIQGRLQSITPMGYEQTLRAYQGYHTDPNDQESYKIFQKPEDPSYDDITTFPEGFSVAKQGVRGTSIFMKKGSLIRHQNFVVPETVTRQTVREYMEGEPIATIAFGSIGIIQPGMLHTIHERSGHFVYDLKTAAPESHMAGFAVAHVLNKGHLLDSSDAIELTKAAQESSRLVAQINDDTLHINSEIDALEKEFNQINGNE